VSLLRSSSKLPTLEVNGPSFSLLSLFKTDVNTVFRKIYIAPRSLQPLPIFAGVFELEGAPRKIEGREDGEELGDKKRMG